MKLQNIKAVLLDADDTLWENNSFFVRSLEWLCGVGRRFGFTDTAIVEIMRELELRHIPMYGFGYDCYEHSLILAVRQIAAARPEMSHLHPGIKQQALQWTHFLRRHPIVFLPGVAETLPSLVKHYPTIVVTKGDYHDQMSKVHRSGILPLLHGVEVVPTKKPEEYTAVLEKYDLAPEDVVMIGNSPASDINNAKRAGMRTIFVPYHGTWEFEMEPILLEEPETIEVRDFSALSLVLDFAI
ncbi:HAD family hydrolase [bacterium]|nr:HAD family hydrolase [bacterium]